MTLRSLLLVLPGLAFLPACSSTGSSSAPVAVMTSDAQAALTPMAILDDLKAGNQRFVAGRTTARNHLGEVDATATGQYPKAVVLSCLDSRVVPELVFDQGIGDLFVGRIAGNFENTDMLGSFEFATAAAGTKLIVVLGHTSCGAVKGAADGVQLGNLTSMLRHFDGALASAKSQVSGEYNSKNMAYVNEAVAANVRATMQDITAGSSVIADQVSRGEVAVVGGVYDLKTGKVAWL